MRLRDFRLLKETDIVYVVKGNYRIFPNYTVEIKEVGIHSINKEYNTIQYFDKHLHNDELALWNAEVRNVFKTLNQAKTAAIRLLNRYKDSLERQLCRLKEQKEYNRLEFKKIRQMKSRKPKNLDKISKL